MEYYEPPPDPLTLGLQTGAFATLLGLAVLLIAIPAAVTAARTIRARRAAGADMRPPLSRCAIAAALAVTLAAVAGWLFLIAATAAPAFADTTGQASDVGLQRDAIAVNHAVAQQFPQIVQISGWRPDPIGGHGDGRALDILIPGAPSSADGMALGDEIVRYVLSHAEQLGIEHVAWRGRLYRPDGTSTPMADRGGDVANHMTHLHVLTHGGGYPEGATTGGAR